MKKDVLLTLSAYLLLFISSFILSINSGLGKAESIHDPSSLLLYGRRGLMVILAIVIPWFTGKQTLSALGWKLTAKWILISFGVGLCIGFGNQGGFNPKEPIAILLALFHTFATELFFRGYLFKTLASSIKGLWIPIVLSSLLYGFFYLTVWTIWAQSGVGKMAFVMLFTSLGIIFAYSYKKSGSFLVPWMIHFLGVLKYRLFF
jgi:membrane protease YdiL (CAAX protease family)